jgi:hypothetical protein
MGQRAREPKRGIEWTGELEDLLLVWEKRVWAASMAHYRRATRLRRGHVMLGVPVVVVTALVGTTLFATISSNLEQFSRSWRLVVGGVSVSAAVLSAIQTFFNFGQRADWHVLAADWYMALRRRIEELRALPPEARGDAKQVLDELRKQINQVSSEYPELRDREWARTTKEIGLEPAPGPGQVAPEKVEAEADAVDTSSSDLEAPKATL